MLPTKGDMMIDNLLMVAGMLAIVFSLLGMFWLMVFSRGVPWGGIIVLTAMLLSGTYLVTQSRTASSLPEAPAPASQKGPQR